MRKGLAILIIVFHFIAVPATAMDALTGTVISVEHKSGRLILQDADTLEHIIVVVRSDHLLGNVKAGSKIRLWGSYTQDDPPIFQAEKIVREPMWRREKDPTGVRSRLVQ